MSWKNIIYEYVHHRNQADLNYAAELLAPFVADPAYISKYESQLRRKANLDELIGRMPLKSETRLKITNTVEREESVTAELSMRCLRETSVNGQEQTEERLERERVTLEPRYGQWIITRVEPALDESALLLGTTSTGGTLHQSMQSLVRPHTLRTPSVPYINTAVVGERWNGARGTYDRGKAAAYADKYWKDPNPDYLYFDVDCTNYVSQCLFAGGGPMIYTDKRELGWWYRGRVNGREEWSFSWAVAHSLQYYLLTSRSGLRAEDAGDARRLELGDIISYDWNGDGRWQHSAVVTAKDSNGMPLVNAHTVSSKHRYWSYQDSHAWTEQTRYRFLHIIDTL